LKNIYIISPYPRQELLKDGMMQRVHIIDSLLSKKNRIYINISFRNKGFTTNTYNECVTEMLFNPFYILTIITKFLLPSQYIYIHSIHSLKYIPYFFLFFKGKKKIILDAHGVVPEEMKMYHKNFHYLYFLWIEKRIFKQLSDCLCVTCSMINHFKNRYSNPLNYHHFSTSELMKIPEHFNQKIILSELNIKEDEVVIIYSGNTQVWQNIPLMIESIRTIKNVKILILTGEKYLFETMLKNAGLFIKSINILSIEPKNLYKYYSICHYGYILRDNNIVNNVANPTKMLEYLQFGITPIVLSPKIGDYLNYNYDYIELKNLKEENLKPIKSLKNIEISKLLKLNENLDLNTLFGL
jgi:glycosyltransferase involved in cell wall biosynthesis